MNVRIFFLNGEQRIFERATEFKEDQMLKRITFRSEYGSIAETFKFYVDRISGWSIW